MSHLLEYEQKLWSRGLDFIAGVDEVGRGSLAGPLVAAAVILDKDHLHPTPATRNNDIVGDLFETYAKIKDSKLLSPKKRGTLSKFIRKYSVSYSIEIIEAGKIDEFGISKATQIAFLSCVNNLGVSPHHILVDSFELRGVSLEKQTPIKGGDNRSISIAAASIVAKVFRDSLMVRFHKENEDYQKYNFAQHKGYGTRAHMEAINIHGACKIHRKSFNPIRKSVTEIKLK